ncbi:hypothetical protein SAMN05216271_1428 [Halopseudomonas sabulinigri]|uniref:Uncharacterized protein n=1 Tax=Halopseudomonas sabulinigri TaxID=472181 RepID=A0A1H1QFH4_9GAMM|nr:hypothetical protein [Halopseudomonas sabulinigri]SDS22063.1 hypothetical protein SAMN05216271_1428 [Halopseudomonas sabulinigri]
MSWRTPETLLHRQKDSSYGRILRHLDQALDMAHTRQWLTGYQAGGVAELELQGLSKEDLAVLWQILETLDSRCPLPGVLPPPAQAGHQQHRDHH